MVRDYELMYIVRPDLDEEGLRAAMESVQALVEAQGGEVTKTTPWGKRRLAYEIDRLRDGHYVLLEIRLDTARVTDVERLLRIHENVFRHMLTVYVPREEREEGEGREGREGRRERGAAGAPQAGAADAVAGDGAAPARAGEGEDGEEAEEVEAVETAAVASHMTDADVREAEEADPESEEDE